MCHSARYISHITQKILLQFRSSLRWYRFLFLSLLKWSLHSFNNSKWQWHVLHTPPVFTLSYCYRKTCVCILCTSYIVMIKHWLCAHRESNNNNTTTYKKIEDAYKECVCVCVHIYNRIITLHTHIGMGKNEMVKTWTNGMADGDGPKELNK